MEEPAAKDMLVCTMSSAGVRPSVTQDTADSSAASAAMRLFFMGRGLQFEGE